MVLMSEKCIGDHQLMFCTFGEKLVAILVGISDSIFPDYSISSINILTNSCIEISKQYKLTVSRCLSDQRVQL